MKCFNLNLIDLFMVYLDMQRIPNEILVSRFNSWFTNISKSRTGSQVSDFTISFCFQLSKRTPAGEVGALVAGLRAAQPIIWWKAFCYHYRCEPLRGYHTERLHRAARVAGVSVALTNYINNSSNIILIPFVWRLQWLKANNRIFFLSCQTIFC